jgi:hypothetical protein
VTNAAPSASLAQRIDLLMHRVEYRLATSPVERKAIYRLRYDAYLREGAIVPLPFPPLADAFDELSNGYTIGAERKGAAR